jgi:FkbM family methyltransferase
MDQYALVQHGEQNKLFSLLGKQTMMRLKIRLKKTIRTLISDLLRSLNQDLINRSVRQAYEICHYYPVDILSFILPFLKSLNLKLYFVQIGANDGNSDDPFQCFVKEYKIPGILVEPQPSAFKKLVKNYNGYPNLMFENAAISETTGELILYRFDRDEEKSFRLDTLTSTNRKILEKHKRDGCIQADIEQILVPSLTFNNLLDKIQRDMIMKSLSKLTFRKFVR